MQLVNYRNQWRSEGMREVRTAPGGNLLGAANGQFKKSRENRPYFAPLKNS